MTPVADVLREARELVAQGWTQGAFARDADGAECRSVDPRATCWCIIGSLGRASAVVGGGAMRPYRSLLAAININGSLSGWNDAPGRTQAEVVAAFTRAIELAEGPR